MTPMFTGDLAFLSNFHMHTFEVPALGELVWSAEHGFNAFKTLDPAQRRAVLDARSPAQAKRVGRSVTLRPGWDCGGRVRAMQTVLVAKFAVLDLRDMLVATGDTALVETNRHHDNFWGDCLCGRFRCAGPGVNMLGELLMALRAKHLPGQA